MNSRLRYSAHPYPRVWTEYTSSTYMPRAKDGSINYRPEKVSEEEQEKIKYWHPDNQAKRERQRASEFLFLNQHFKNQTSADICKKMYHTNRDEHGQPPTPGQTWGGIKYNEQDTWKINNCDNWWWHNIMRPQLEAQAAAEVRPMDLEFGLIKGKKVRLHWDQGKRKFYYKR